MISINDSKRLIKRILLSNLITEKKNLFLTPLISGKHGIGKSQIIKSIAYELGGICFTIEGGTLKEGEITGIPYQYKDDNGKIHFRFLPYYAIEYIQKIEREINFGKEVDLYIEKDLLSPNEKINLILNKEIKPIILFIDEINRTDTMVFKELMNILLTRSINGYQLPWWVFFVAAMNPSTDGSSYQTNEMDPAQLDRFFKIVVKEDVGEWIKYASKTKVEDGIIEFIRSNKGYLSSNDKSLLDTEEPTPSPRSWDMVDTIIKSTHALDAFFEKEELSKKYNDVKKLIEFKVGKKISVMLFQFLQETERYSINDFINDTDDLSIYYNKYSKLPPTSHAVLANQIAEYLRNNYSQITNDSSLHHSVSSKLTSFFSKVDSSVAILLIQGMINSKSTNGKNIFVGFSNVFTSSLLERLNVSFESLISLQGK